MYHRVGVKPHIIKSFLPKNMYFSSSLEWQDRGGGLTEMRLAVPQSIHWLSSLEIQLYFQ